MANVNPIRTEEDYEAALARVSDLMDALSCSDGQIEDENHPGRVELDVLVDLVEHYEDKHYPIGLPSPIAAIEFHMDQHGLAPRDLIPFIGSRAKVSEVLSGKRDITMAMARALHQHLGISANVLLQEPGAAFDTTFDHLDPRRFPLKEMAKRGWIRDDPNLMDNAEEVIAGLIERAVGPAITEEPLYRRNDCRRVNAKTDDYALRAWCWQVMATANDHPLDVTYKPDTVTRDFLRSVAQLSPSEDGPRRARDFLARRGIVLQVVPHLPRTHLDGAALRLASGRPVIGLTLRYDRIDNFWFCLLHELAHVGLHLDSDEDVAFVDDHTLRDIEDGGQNPKEKEADEWAENALIPEAAWESSPVRAKPTAMGVISLAQSLQVHPAIIAGRIRHERRNYRLLSQFVGTGQVRRQFENRES